VFDWKSNLVKICDGYKPRDISNIDETGLIYRISGNKSFHVKGDEAAGGKQSKERLTIALCASRRSRLLSSVNQQSHDVSRTSK